MQSVDTQLAIFFNKSATKLKSLANTIADKRRYGNDFSTELELALELLDVVEELNDDLNNWDDYFILKVIHYYNSKAKLNNVAEGSFTFLTSVISDQSSRVFFQNILGEATDNLSLLTNFNFKVNISDIINDLISTDINKPLSAAQGKVLKDSIDTFASQGESNTTSSSGSGLSIVLPKSGINLPFRSILGTSNEITVTQNSLDLTFSLPTGINANKIADGTVSSTEFQYINTLSSNAQTQLDNKQPLNSDLTSISGLTPTNDDILQYKSGAWSNRTITQVTADLNLFTQTLKGLVPPPTTLNNFFLRDDGTWVENVITASNGLIKTGNDITLGGSITQTTFIDATNKNFSIYRGSSPFDVETGIEMVGGIMYIYNSSTVTELFSNTVIGFPTGVLDIGGKINSAFKTKLRFSDLETTFTDTRVTRTGIQYAGDYSGTYTDRSLVDRGYVLGSKTYTGIQTFGSVTFNTAPSLADGVKWVFNPNATNAGINVGAQAGNPSSLANGDLWYNSSTGTLNARISSATVSLSTGGGIGLTDGDKGDITVSSSGTVWTIDSQTVSYSKIQNISTTDRLLGRDTAAAGVIEELIVSGGIEFTGLGGIQISAFTGDVTKTAGGTVTTIDNDIVTYAKMQNISATNRFIGRITSGAGDPEELTGTQATTLLDNFTTSLKGLTPASGGGTTNFLRADGTWTNPVTTPAGSNTEIQFNSSGAFGSDTDFTFTGGNTLNVPSINTNDIVATGQLNINVTGGDVQANSDSNFLIGGGQVGLYGDADVFINVGGTQWLTIYPTGDWEVDGSKGTAGQILTSAGTGASVTWEDNGTFLGNVNISVVGNGLLIKEGSNSTMGVATLSSGTVVVNTTKVTANSRIFLTVNGGTLTNVGSTYISARTAGTSFTISSTNIIDASTVAWVIIEPS